MVSAMEQELILQAREERMKLIASYTKNHQCVVVIKANIPGEFKNNKEAYTLLRLFEQECRKHFEISSYKLIHSADGPYAIIVTPEQANMKQQLIEIETHHPLGRMIDLDYYTNDEKSVSRLDLGLPPRKCYLCDREASLCIREKTHSDKRIFAYIQTQVYAYIQDILEKMVLTSIKTELDLEDKFGLVSPKSQGSHDDMNYVMMLRSAKALLFSFTQMFWIGFDGVNLDQVYEQGKKQGIIAERAMYDVTNDVNTYKGLIFILGMMLLSCGYAMSHEQTIDQIFDNIKFMGRHVFREPVYNTFGEKAYREYNMGGAKAEAEQGYPIVRKCYEQLLQGPLSPEALHMALIDIIRSTDDTVLLKRAGSLEEYHRIKALISNITTYDEQVIRKVTEECIRGHISCGGAADILITAVFLTFFSRQFLSN